jgi:hypothetical protein
LPSESIIVATGVYDVTRPGPVSPAGRVSWTLARGRDGGLLIGADEVLLSRRSRFEGRLDSAGRWTGSTETVHFTAGEGAGKPEIHHLETFFHRSRIHLVRFRDRAYPLHQSRTVEGPTPFLPINYPVAAVTFLSDYVRTAGGEQPIAALAHIGNRYRGGGLEVQAARIRHDGGVEVEGPTGRVAGHRFQVRYDGGWNDSTVELWTDTHGVPMRANINATDGPLEYRLVNYDVKDAAGLPRLPGRSAVRDAQVK